MRLFNTLTRHKEEFVPIREGEVGLYVCGPTVYNYFHIGNARAFVMFDVLRRYLVYSGYKVTYVQNFTDIDDKMIKEAENQGVTIAELAERFIAEYDRDAAMLNMLPADIRPRATEHIDDILALIGRLFDNGLAYQTQDGVYFDTHAYAPYGALSGQNINDREAGARVEVDENKRNPSDFALWKARRGNDPYWPSPWGEGRPGWHIECSAMSMKYLGESFDIHAGGEDLIFPHHENELAQSRGATGKPFARYWMHNGFINVDNVKMSKSLGNFFTVRDISEKFDLEAVRFFLLGAHYRSPVNFTAAMIEQAHSGLSRLYNAYGGWKSALSRAPEREYTPDDNVFVDETVPELKARFISHMDDDFNTAGAIGVLFELVREGNTYIAHNPVKRIIKELLNVFNELCGILGLLYKQEGGIDPSVEILAKERREARARKDWVEADKLREQILSLGYTVKDTPGGYELARV